MEVMNKRSSSFSDVKIRMIQGAILALALTIFLGNLMMWIIMPTSTYYEKWVPVLVAATNSTFFDIQGILIKSSIFSIPFLILTEVDSGFEYYKFKFGSILLKTREFLMEIFKENWLVRNFSDGAPLEKFVGNLRVFSSVCV